MNCSINVSEGVELFQFVVYIPTFIIGLIVNILALWAFCWKLRKWTETTIYVVNLALSDIVLLSSLPFKMLSNGVWVKNSIPLCIFAESLYFVNMYASICIITCISVDRYIAIKHPFRAKALRSPKKAAFVCTAVWIITCLGTVLVYRKYYNQLTKENILCFKQVAFENDYPVTVSLSVVGFTIPLIIVTFCSVQIIQALRQSNMTGSGEFNTVKTIRIIAASAIIFVVCFTPVHIGYFLQWLPPLKKYCTGKQHVNSFLQVSTCIANINCCLDGFGYYFASTEVCDIFKLQRKKRKNPRATSNIATIDI